MSHSCPNLVSTSFLYNPYIPFFLFAEIFFLLVENNVSLYFVYAVNANSWTWH